MENQKTEKHQQLTTFECLNFLSVTSAICSTVLVYLMLLGPLFIVTPWIMFYGFKHKSSYFHGWTWSRVIFVSITSYLLGLALGTLSLYTLIGMGHESLIPSVVLAIFLVGDLIYSSFVFCKRIIQSV
jgi:hypothetical protein